MNLLEKIGSIIITIGVAVSSLFGGVPQVPTRNVGSTVPQAPALFETSLQASIGSSDTSMTLVANTLKNGNSLSGYACFTIDEGLSNIEYVCGTVASTAVTGMTRGVDPLSGTTTVASLQFAHRRGADVKITDYPVVGILSRIASGIDGFPGPVHYDSNLTFSSSTQLVTMGYVDNATATLAALAVLVTGNQTVGGVKTFSSLPSIPLTPLANTDAASKGYVDGVAVAGAPNAATTTKGIVQLPTRTDLASSTYIGSTGAYLAIPSGYATSTFGIATTSVVITNTNGVIDPTLLSLGSFGGGSDGDVTIAANSTTTLTRDMFYNNLTVNGVLVMNNYRVFVKNTLTGTLSGNNGFIKSNGNIGSDGSSATGGAQAATTTGYFVGCAGTKGSNGASGGSTGANAVNAISPSFSSLLSGVGGTGGTADAVPGGAGGTVGQNTGTTTDIFRGSFAAYLSQTDIATSTSLGSLGLPFMTRIRVGGGGSGGGSGGGGTGPGTGGGGGGGGECGGVVFLAASNFSGTFTIQAFGGQGGKGGNAAVSDGGGGGGGGGGIGGIVERLYSTDTWSGSCSVTGGAGGGGGNGNAGAAGSSGASGATGQCYAANITQLIR